MSETEEEKWMRLADEYDQVHHWVKHDWICPLDTQTCCIRYLEGRASSCRNGEVYFWGCQVDIKQRENRRKTKEK